MAAKLPIKTPAAVAEPSRPYPKSNEDSQLRMTTAAAIAVIGLSPATATAQESEPSTVWQAEKCRIYRQAWETALDFFGTDNMNYNFIAQNENFMASGCTEPVSVCAQSNQELEIANALTIAMMNAGAASTFLPFHCEDNMSSMPTSAVAGVASDSELCWSQLDLLNAGGKLLGDEATLFEAQCACLEQKEQGVGTYCAK